MNHSQDSLPIRMFRSGDGLLPSNRYAAQRLNEIPQTTRVEIVLRRKRSRPHNAKYWALLHEVVKASEKYPTAEHLHRALLMALGYTSELIMLDGKVVVVPDSTAFSKMAQGTFDEYWTKVVALLATLLDTDPMTLLKNSEAA